MSNYFSYFPPTSNDLKQNGQFITVTNILRRFKFRSSVQDNVDIFYEYTVQTGDRPDTIAEKYYGSPNYAWIILHFNNINDPFFGWPLFDKQLEDYIVGKYGSIPAAQAAVHEYRRILRNSEVKYDGEIIPKKFIVVDQTTYNSLNPSNRELINKYDYELELNEKKRIIKILDRKYLPQVRSEVEDILKNGV
jgi:hypothetical protein